MTASLPARMEAAGGPEGRGCGIPNRRRERFRDRRVPRSLGEARRSSSILTGRRDARPHNHDAGPPKAVQKAGDPGTLTSGPCGRDARTTIFPLPHRFDVTAATEGEACRRVVDGQPQR
jgi:hypothetical protein